MKNSNERAFIQSMMHVVDTHDYVESDSLEGWLRLAFNNIMDEVRENGLPQPEPETELFTEVYDRGWMAAKDVREDADVARILELETRLAEVLGREADALNELEEVRKHVRANPNTGTGINEADLEAFWYHFATLDVRYPSSHRMRKLFKAFCAERREQEEIQKWRYS